MQFMLTLKLFKKKVDPKIYVHHVRIPQFYS